MENHVKLSILEKIKNAALKTNILLTAEVSETSDFMMTGQITDNVSVEELIRGAADVMILRAEAKLPGVDESRLVEIAAEVVENADIKYEIYDDAIHFSHILSLIKMDPGIVEKHAFGEGLKFIRKIAAYKGKLRQSQNFDSSVITDDRNGTDTDEFDYDSLFDSLTEVHAETIKDEELVTPVETAAEDAEISIEDTHDTHNISGEDTGTSDAFLPESINSNDLDALIDALGINVSEELVGHEKETEVQEENVTFNKEEKEEYKEQSTRPVQLPEQHNDEDQPKRESKRARRNRNKRAKLAQMADNIENNNNSASDLMSAAIGFMDASAINNNEKEDRNLIPENENTENHEESDTASQETYQEDVHDDEEKVFDVQGSVSYERAPEVKTQFKQMFEELTTAFEERKKQADVREATLNKLAGKLERQEKRLEEKANKINEDYNAKLAEFEKKETEHFAEQQKLNLQRESIAMERQNVLDMKAALEEQQTTFNRLLAIEGIEPEEIKTHLDGLHEQIDKLTARAEEAESRRNENTEALQKARQQVADLQKKVSLIDPDGRSLSKLQSANESMKAKCAELTSQLASASAKDRKQTAVIEALVKRQSVFKNIEADNQSLKNQITSIRDSFEKEKTELQDQLKASKEDIERVKSEVADKSELETADARIKELEDLLNNKELLIKDAENTVKKKEDEFEFVKAEYEAKMAEIKTQIDSGDITEEMLVARINAIVEAFNNDGIKLNIIPGEGEKVLSGSYDNMTVAVNANANVAYVEAPVRKGIKYKRMIEEWNQEDIRIAYAFEDKRLIAKAFGRDLLSLTKEIISKFNDLN